MGFFDALGTVLDRVAPTALAFVAGGPAAALQTAAAVEKAKRNEKILERQAMNPFELQSRNMRIQDFNARAPGFVSEPGFFAPGGAFRTGVRDFGGFLSDLSPIANVFGFGDRFNNIPPSGARTINRQAPEETSNSGEITGANIGMVGPLVQGARNFATSRVGQGLIGGAAGFFGAELMDGAGGRPRITRKMKSDVRKIYMMAGMDPAATAQILNNLGTYPRINFNASVVFFILTKRFRNDGPVVTKAAVRKTRTTLRRMKGIVDLHNSICKTPTRRAAPRKTMPKAVQLIKN